MAPPELPVGSDNSGFLLKVIAGLVGFISVAMMSFFGWLAMAVINLEAQMATANTNIGNLLAGQTVKAAVTTAETGQRLNVLEEKPPEEVYTTPARAQKAVAPRTHRRKVTTPPHWLPDHPIP